MDRQPDSLLKLTETNDKSLYQFQDTASANAEEEKWNLGWLVAVARRRALLMVKVTLGTTLLAGGLLFLLANLTPPQYSGKFQLLVEPITAEEQLARSSTRAQVSDTPDAQRINIEQSSLDYESQIRILQGPKLLDPLVNQVRHRYSDMTYEILIKNLKIERITTLSLDKKELGTKLINVTYQDTDPQKVKFVLECLSETYLKYSRKERQSTIRHGIEFIDSQLAPLSQRVHSLQGQIQALRQRYTLVDPEQQGKELVDTAGRLDQSAVEAQTLVAEAGAKRNTLARQLRNANPQAILGETTYYQALLTQYQQVEGQIAIESARYSPDHPTMKTLLEKRQNLQNLLNREASRVLATAADSTTVAGTRLQAINQAQAKTNQRIRQLAGITLQYNDLQRELTLATESLNKFVTRRQALQVDAAQQEIPWELTVPPRLELDELSRPIIINNISKIRFLALIALLSVLLGVGVGFLVETIQDLLHTTDEVKQATRLPLLGVIPHNDSQPPAVSAPVTEAFRSLFKNLCLVSKNYTPIGSLMITSAEEGDGKSTIALHLAMTAAAMGQKVLLVDADLCHPQIHELLGLSNQQGLINLILGNQEFQEVTQSPPSCANLAVLTAGQLPVDPVEFFTAIFTANRTEPLFQQLQDMFDLVIVDMPPLCQLADSWLIANQCDSLALVVRLGKTSRPSVLAALEELKFLSKAVLGVIANDAPNSVALAPSYYNRVRPLVDITRKQLGNRID